MITTSGFLKAL